MSIIYIYLAVTIVAGSDIVILTIRRMTKNLHDVTTVMERVNESNAEQLPRIDLSAKDEIGSIALAYNKMVTNLKFIANMKKNC